MSLVTTLGNFLLGSKALGVGVVLGFGDGFCVGADAVGAGVADCAKAFGEFAKLPEIRAIAVKSTGMDAGLKKNLIWEKRAFMSSQPLGLIL